MKQNLIEFRGEIDSSTIRVGVYNTQLSIMDRTTRLKIIKGTQDLNNTINELGKTDIHRTL